MSTGIKIIMGIEMDLSRIKEKKIAVVGLGYVGLPLAVEFSSQGFTVTGFDVNAARISQLRAGDDRTGEVEESKLKNLRTLSFTSIVDEITEANVYIITVPTPIDCFKIPDLEPLRKASRIVGGALKHGDVVIYESTVYPGCTEEICIPILEFESGLSINSDFGVGYSPERINPGDRGRGLSSITKVTSGSSQAIAEFVDNLYKIIITAGTHCAPTIKVAEAAKVIENTQRDLNIALINELAMLFDKLDIKTTDVLSAASTKWNFLNFQPGLVGGHCIGVDPYYLTHKAMEVGFNPELVLAGRRTNDNMASWIAGRVVKEVTKRGKSLLTSRVLILGLTFKENCPDTRNTKILDLVRELRDFSCQVEVADPLADPFEANDKYGLMLKSFDQEEKYDVIILAVPHRQYVDLGGNLLKSALREDGFVFDLKGVLKPEDGIFVL